MDEDEPIELEPRYEYRINWNAMIGFIAFILLLMGISQVAGPDAAGWTLVLGLLTIVWVVIRRRARENDTSWIDGGADGVYSDDWNVGGDLGGDFGGGGGDG